MPTGNRGSLPGGPQACGWLPWTSSVTPFRFTRSVGRDLVPDRRRHHGPDSRPDRGGRPGRAIACRSDLVVACGEFGLTYLSIYQGEADGSFTHVRDSKVGTEVTQSLLTDVNGDGRRTTWC